MKRVLTLILALVMALSLCACGGGSGSSGGSEDAACVGTYTCTTITMGDATIEAPEGSLDLQKGGKGTLVMSGDTFDVTYTLEEDALTLTVDGQDAAGTYADGVVTVDLFGATCTFEPSAE